MPLFVHLQSIQMSYQFSKTREENFTQHEHGIFFNLREMEEFRTIRHGKQQGLAKIQLLETSIRVSFYTLWSLLRYNQFGLLDSLDLIAPFFAKNEENFKCCMS